MTEENQIEEMAEMLEIIEKARDEYANDITDHSENEYIREGLLNAGYRKQVDRYYVEPGKPPVLIETSENRKSEGEWVRYPHNSGIYCSLCKHKRRYRDIHDNFCPHCGAKMKGERK